MNQIFMYYLLQTKTLIMKSWLQKFFGGLQGMSQKKAHKVLPQRVFLFSFFMMLSFFSHAQNTTTVSGSVTDTSGVIGGNGNNGPFQEVGCYTGRWNVFHSGNRC